MTYIAQAAGLRPFGPAVALLPRPARAGGTLVAWGHCSDRDPCIQNKKAPSAKADGAVLFKSLTMTYSRMGKCHTTIGAGLFHV